MANNSFSSDNQGPPDYEPALNRLAQRKPGQVILYEDGLLLVEVKRQNSLFRELKLWPHERLYAPEYIAFDSTTFSQTVFFELSWVSHNDQPAEHSSQLLHRQIHQRLKHWVEERLNPASPGYAKQVNMHDLASADKEIQSQWLAAAIPNSLALLNRHDATPETDKAAAALAWRFFSALDEEQKSQAVEILTRYAGRSLFCLPESLRNFEACNAAISSSLANLKLVPHEHLVNGLYEQYCQGKPDALPFTNLGHMDEALARIAIRCHPKALLYLPVIFHTRAMYDYALTQHGESIAFVLEQRLNEALCEQAASFHADALAHIPPRFLTKAVLSAACANNRSFFYYIPPVYRTLEVCRIAVELEPTSRQWVPVALLKGL